IERDSINDIDNLPGFLWQTARNSILNQYRSNATAQKLAQDVSEHFFAEDGTHNDPERVYIGKDDVERITRTLRNMPAIRSRVFLLNRMDGLSHSAIAELVGLSRSAVTKHIARASQEIESAGANL
ncbi:MAG: RNA polymerase sigma factor, partial [Pseudomonadota bacterium]